MESVAVNSCPASFARRFLQAANDQDDNMRPSAASSNCPEFAITERTTFLSSAQNSNEPRDVSSKAAPEVVILLVVIWPYRLIIASEHIQSHTSSSTVSYARGRVSKLAYDMLFRGYAEGRC